MRGAASRPKCRVKNALEIDNNGVLLAVSGSMSILSTLVSDHG